MNTNETPSAPTATPLRASVSTRLRVNFLAGVLITAPVAITIYVGWLFINYVDSKVKPLIPAPYNPEHYLPYSIPGLGLLFILAFLVLVGALAKGFLGRAFIRTSESVMKRIPVLRSIYSAIKQIMETVLSSQSQAFRECVLVEYPRKGLWVLGFLTGKTTGEAQDKTARTTVNVFIPTTPNPTSGFLLFVPQEDIISLEMSVEDGIKLVVSGGIVSPPYPVSSKI